MTKFKIGDRIAIRIPSKFEIIGIEETTNPSYYSLINLINNEKYHLPIYYIDGCYHLTLSSILKKL